MTTKSFSARNLSSLFALLALGLSAPPSPAQQEDPAPQAKVWVNHQAARLVIGQSSFTRQDPTPTRSSIGGAGGVAIGGNRLFVADGNRIGAGPIGNRVLVYNNLSDFVPVPEATLPQDGDCPACVGLADVVLGQSNFETIDAAAGGGMKAPSAVASDGQVLAVADTNNNRVLLWLSIPSSNGVAPNVILGQPDNKTVTPKTSRDGMRGPQGVWIGEGKLFVADTQNSRILIWNQIPQQNGAQPDVVIGQPDFDTRPEPDLTQSDYGPTAKRLYDPIGVSTANGKMFVADLGFDRVLIYNTIPTSNDPAADVVLGQPDFETTGFFDHDDDTTTAAIRRAVYQMCEPLGPFADDGSTTPDDYIYPDPIDRTDPEDPVTRYPKRCEYTLNFPRAVISDGQRLFIADSGNDRILVYNEIPTESGTAADIVIGQPNFIAMTDSVGPGNVRSPTAMALDDNNNLYVADPYVRRVLVFSPGVKMVDDEGIRNGASFAIYANGYVQWEGATTDDGQLVQLDISGRHYEMTTAKGETGESVRNKMLQAIQDDEYSLVTATPENGLGTFSKAGIRFGGTVRSGESVTLQVGDIKYEFVTNDFDAEQGPYILVDRFKYLIDHAETELPYIATRSESELEVLVLTAKKAGPELNGTPFAIYAAADTQLTVEYAPSDPVVFSGGAFPARIRLTAKFEGRPGNAVTIDNQLGGAGITTSTSGARLEFGSDARQLPAGTFAAIFGEGFSDQVYTAGVDENGLLPTRLGGVEVYTNGVRSPIYAVTPNQINYQVPWEVAGQGVSTWVRRVFDDGSVRVSIARANDVTRAAPGVFTYPGNEPRQAVALHGQGTAEGSVALSLGTGVTSGSTQEQTETVDAGATVTITINGRTYAYTTQTDDTLEAVRDRLIELINNGNDPDAVAEAGRQGFFSARATVDLAGTPAAGDVVTITIGSDPAREYSYTVQEDDTLTVIRNVLVQRINGGLGDREVTARVLDVIGAVEFQVVARSLGEDGNLIAFAVDASSGAGVDVTTNVEDGFLIGGQTPPVVIIRARASGRDGNSVTYTAESSDLTIISATARTATLCCGNDPFTPITTDNPAVPGEHVIVYASGLGLTSPLPKDAGLQTGQVTPESQLFTVPAVADDFVSSRIGGRTATVEFVGLAPGMVGVYQVNLILNEQLPDDPLTPVTVEQGFYISNAATIPVKNLTPRDPDTTVQ
ncbi:MAG: hypothetical protein GC160_08130 [Acidobacteria bacterium]|nr:hypothetical protein [Acidobacteriota bacterium]